MKWLYKKDNALEKIKIKPPPSWRQDVLTYYEGDGNDGGEINDEGLILCHIGSLWHLEEHVKAEQIVPFFPDIEGMSEMLFGTQSEDLTRAGNSLLLSKRITRWFRNYCLVVVPVDKTEAPIRRWRTDVVFPSIRNTYFTTELTGKDIDGKERHFPKSTSYMRKSMIFALATHFQENTDTRIVESWMTEQGVHVF